jgi:elongation factor Ts
MANVTAADVKKLRDLTAAGMLDCRNALVEAGGDFDKAVELLRIKGAKDVSRRAGRTAANGVVAHSGNALLELNCETDFVAKNAEFVALAQRLVDHAAALRPESLDALLASTLPDGRTVADTVSEQSAKIGERLVLNRFAVLDGSVVVYLHRKSPDLPPQVGVLVSFSGGGDGTGESGARGVAMQIAAMRPRYLTRQEVPAEVVETERRLAEQTAREEGKPEGAITKITEGRVNAFFKDFVLLEQASVVEPKKPVSKILQEAGLTVHSFVRFEVGQT